MLSAKARPCVSTLPVLIRSRGLGIFYSKQEASLLQGDETEKGR